MPYLDNWLAFLSAYEVYEKEFEMHLVDQVWGTLPTLAAAVINDHRRRVLALIEGGSGAEASSSSSYSSYSSLTIDPTTRKTTKEDGTAATPMACFWEASLPPFTGPFFRLLLEASLRNENPTVVRHGLERFLDGSRTMDLKQALYRPIFKHVPALPSATGADEEEEEEDKDSTLSAGTDARRGRSGALRRYRGGDGGEFRTTPSTSTTTSSITSTTTTPRWRRGVSVFLTPRPFPGVVAAAATRATSGRRELYKDFTTDRDAGQPRALLLLEVAGGAGPHAAVRPLPAARRAGRRRVRRRRRAEQQQQQQQQKWR